MNTIFVVLALVAAVSASVMPLHGSEQVTAAEERLFEEYILRKFREAMEQLEKIDPIEKDYDEFNIHAISGTVENALVSGFSNQDITDLLISINPLHPGVKITYEIPHFQASVEHYTLDGLVFGDGTTHLKTRGIKVEFVARYNVLFPWRSEFKFASYIEAEFHLTGLFHNEELSKKIRDYVNLFLASLNIGH